MQHLYNPDGTRNRDFRPYIYAEETTYETSIYDPSRSVDYGLYSHGVQPGANTTIEDHHDYMELLHNTRADSTMIMSHDPRIPCGTNKMSPTAYQPRHVRPIYSYHSGSDGKQGMYKQLYAL